MKQKIMKEKSGINGLHSIDILPVSVEEAEKLLQRELKTYQDIREGAEKFLTTGIQSVLIINSYFNENNLCHDYWTDGQTAFWLSSQHPSSNNFQDKNPILYSSLKKSLQLNQEIKDAIVLARMEVNRAIRKSTVLKGKSTLMLHAEWPEEESDLPYLSADPILEPPPQFPSTHRKQLGLYPIVDSSDWLARLLPLGVKTAQLRIKDKKGRALEDEIKKSIMITEKYQANLFINDHWEMAIRYDAYGVHLGQEDLEAANIKAIRDAGLRLGISTHCYYEVARAHAVNPSYIACGPIFTTISKVMSFPPQGIAQLKQWRRILNYPLVAIGGINLKRIPEVLATHVDAIALISAITQATDPIRATEILLAMVKQHVTDN